MYAWVLSIYCGAGVVCDAQVMKEMHCGHPQNCYLLDFGQIIIFCILFSLLIFVFHLTQILL